MDIVGAVSSYILLAILGVASILTLLARELGWPPALVRHFAALKKSELDGIIKQVVLEQNELRNTARQVRAAAIQEAGRYDAPVDRLRHLVRGAVERREDGELRAFAAEVPFFVDFMTASTDPTFANECALILASYLRMNRDETAEFDVVIGLKQGSPLIAAALAAKLGLPLILYRGQGARRRRDMADLDTRDYFDGDAALLQKRAMIVDDSTTGGTMMLDCTFDYRGAGGEIRGALILFEVLGRNGREALLKNGVEVYSVDRIDLGYVTGLSNAK